MEEAIYVPFYVQLLIIKNLILRDISLYRMAEIADIAGQNRTIADIERTPNGSGNQH